MEILWVRWFERDTRYRSGLKQKRLPRLRYMDHEDPDAFGFLDPQDVVRGSHFIPAFHHGRTSEYLPKSIIRRDSENDKDWKFYYANMCVISRSVVPWLTLTLLYGFVDRDMLMRYHDNVIGHRRHFPAAPNPPSDDSPEDSPPSEQQPAGDGLDDAPRDQDGSEGVEGAQEEPMSTDPSTTAATQADEDDDDDDDGDYEGEPSGDSKTETEEETEEDEDEGEADGDNTLLGDDEIRDRLGYDVF
ncbi:hypothetical protein B0H13DRAFT_2336967 [Mycena leptocephala]|nr:hypothetical protein B0H13DRAFT_2336967 [Mycena leptocephala]